MIYLKANECKFSSLREELESLVDVMNQSLQKNPVVSEDGEIFLSIRLEDNSDCVVFKYKLINIDVADIDEENMVLLMESLKPIVLDNIKTMSLTISVIERMMDAQYIFKIEYIDKKEEPICTIKIVPDDYQ